jgi:hypothetical protein
MFKFWQKKLEVGEFRKINQLACADVDDARLTKKDPAMTYAKASSLMKTMIWLTGKYACSNETLNEINVAVQVLEYVIDEAKSEMAAKQKVEKLELDQFMKISELICDEIDDAKLAKKDPVITFVKATSWIKALNSMRRDLTCSDDTLKEIDVLVDVLHDVVTECKSEINIDTLMASEQNLKQLAAATV